MEPGRVFVLPGGGLYGRAGPRFDSGFFTCGPPYDCDGHSFWLQHHRLG